MPGLRKQGWSTKTRSTPVSLPSSSSPFASHLWWYCTPCLPPHRLNSRQTPVGTAPSYWPYIGITVMTRCPLLASASASLSATSARPPVFAKRATSEDTRTTLSFFSGSAPSSSSASRAAVTRSSAAGARSTGPSDMCLIISSSSCFFSSEGTWPSMITLASPSPPSACLRFCSCTNCADGTCPSITTLPSSPLEPWTWLASDMSVRPGSVTCCPSSVL
mmetsp:Transcript_6180/g.15796  ORF Transcript_6180/g.15796 Transcript_6180/m.15796 type:complete len:219 (-) Transcript_6180:118-774(-)